MWRPNVTVLRNISLLSMRENTKFSKLFYSTRNRLPRSTTKLTLISAGIGVIVGAGIGGYEQYKISMRKTGAAEKVEYAFFKVPPKYSSQYKVYYDSDISDLQLVLFQYQTCPFCCKVRAYLDVRNISYEIVEVDAVLRQAIKWSGYKKVPILLAKVNGGYQQLFDSTAIISMLETHLGDKSYQLQDVVKFYPITTYVDEAGKNVSEVMNKYRIMHTNVVLNKEQGLIEDEERQWRQWADNVLVHTLSPNVYRTASESLDTFKWFEEAGGWKKSFPSWECAIMVYVGAVAMWVIAKRLKKRHNIKDDVRQSLYDAANEWMAVINKKGTPFHGGKIPNLADISVFGIFSSIEGCRAFQDMKDNTDIGKWFDDMKMSTKKSRGTIIMA